MFNAKLDIIYKQINVKLLIIAIHQPLTHVVDVCRVIFSIQPNQNVYNVLNLDVFVLINQIVQVVKIIIIIR